MSGSLNKVRRTIFTDGRLESLQSSHIGETIALRETRVYDFSRAMYGASIITLDQNFDGEILAIVVGELPVAESYPSYRRDIPVARNEREVSRSMESALSPRVPIPIRPRYKSVIITPRHHSS